MSADNGIYLLQTKDGYRVAHLQAIDNIYWWYVCCSYPDVIYLDGNRQCEYCWNCGTKNPECIKKDKICPDRLKEMFGDCEVWNDKKSAWNEAIRLYKEITSDEMGICEYGIQEINYNEEFPQ